jgi:hypothetical protein
MRRNLSDESGQQNYKAQLDVPDNKCGWWTDGDTVVHEASGRRDTHLAGHLAGGMTCGKNSAGRKLEAIMAGVVVTIAISVFLGGVMVGVLAVMAIAIRREDRRHTLVGEAPNRMSKNTRRLTGMTRVGMSDEFLRPVGQIVP